MTPAEALVKLQAFADDLLITHAEVSEAVRRLLPVVNCTVPHEYADQLDALAKEEGRLWALRKAFTMGQDYERGRK